jgi:membrane protein DedA with SNARE-associated domain
VIAPVWTGITDTAVGSAAPQAVGYPMLFMLVTLGSVVPVVPTGAVVSAAAVVAWHSGRSALDLPLVLAVATVAAWVGDVLLYWLAVHAGGRWAKQLRGHLDGSRLRGAQDRLAENGRTLLVVSRLIPAGRIPVMAACLVSGWSVARFTRDDVFAVVAWALCYQAIGVVGGSLFPDPWQGVAAALVLVLLIAALPSLRRRLRREQPGTPTPAAEDRAAH